MAKQKTNVELNWHKHNIDIVLKDTANNQDMMYIYAVANAVNYILERMHRQEERERKAEFE